MFSNIYQPYRNYITKDPEARLQAELNYLNNNIQLGYPSYNISDANGVTITGKQMLGNFIIRSVAPGTNDQVDTATNIIQALRNKLKSINNRQYPEGTFPNGTSFTWKIYNSTGSTVTINSNTGVSFGSSDGDIDSGQATGFLMIVTGQTLLGDAADTISIINFDY